MLTEAEKYQKVNEWLLKNVNPELAEIQSCVEKIVSASGPTVKEFSPFTTKPTNLLEVLLQVQRTEQCICQIAKVHNPSFKYRDLPDPINTLPEMEKILVTFLPKIDESLTIIEDAIVTINKTACNVELNPAPTNYSQQSELQKQARFIDKAKRIKQNLLLQQDLLLKNPVPNNLAIELLYEAPQWSVPPETHFYFEVRRGDSLLTKIDVSDAGHYLLGRLPICDIVMNDETCSRQHAVVQFRPSDPDENGEVHGPTDEIYIYDLGSTSGTYVNGMPLQERAYYPLYPGDILQFGQFPNAFVLREGSLDEDSGNESNEQTSTPVVKTTEEKVDSPKDSTHNSDDSPRDVPTDLHAIKDEPAEMSDSFQDRSTEPNDSEEPRPDTQAEVKQENEEGIPAGGKRPSLDSSLDGLSPDQADKPRKPNVKPIVQIVKPATKLQPVVSLDPKSQDFDKEAYKSQMIEAYERQREENLELLRKQQEREKQGLPPIVYIPYVPDRPKKKKWFGRKL